MTDAMQGVLIGGLLAGGFTITSVVITAIMSYKAEVRKQKSEQHIQKLEALFVKLVEFYEKLSNSKDLDTNALMNEYKQLSTELFLWGTAHTVRLTAELQKLLELIDENNPTEIADNVPIAESQLNCLCCLVLLICQVKYDYIGEKTCPKYWYKIKYSANALKFRTILKYNNKIAFRLYLHWFMYIKIA